MSKEVKRIKAAEAVYRNNYEATDQQLKDLEFNSRPSKEYIKEKVLEVIAECYVD